MPHTRALVTHVLGDSEPPGFLGRLFIQTTLPHSDPQTTQYTRRNGDVVFTMVAPSTPGLPYGSLPRLVLTWLTGEAIRTKSRTLVLGASLTEFMRELNIVPKGGKDGTTNRLVNQLWRLFATTMSFQHITDARVSGQGMLIAEDYELFWHPRDPKQRTMWQSSVSLTLRFFEEITRSPVPLDMAALRALKKSPLALDIYAWLTHRMGYLRRSTLIPWQGLAQQFGADYGRPRDFRATFSEALAQVKAVYPQARANATGEGLELAPSWTSISR